MQSKCAMRLRNAVGRCIGLGAASQHGALVLCELHACSDKCVSVGMVDRCDTCKRVQKWIRGSQWASLCSLGVCCPRASIRAGWSRVPSLNKRLGATPSSIEEVTINNVQA